MTLDPANPRTKSIKTTRNLWAALSELPFPRLHELAPAGRDCFVLLDTYLSDCLEEWVASGGQLTAHSMMLLANCAQSITKRFWLLDSEGQYYVGQFKRLARQILRSVDSKTCVSSK